MWIKEYRELLKVLTISDLKVKYQNSLLGFAWSLLNPLLLMLVLYLVFKNIFLSEQNFALYILIGIVTWRFFANGTSVAMYSIASKPSLVTKIYIPRQILVLSTMLSGFISSLLEFFVLFVLLIFFGIKLNQYILLFPFFHLIYLMFVYGMSLALAALYIYYRDLTQIWEVILQLGFFVAPIVYPISVVPKEYLEIYMLNPIAAIMQIYRDIMLNATMPSSLLTIYFLLISCITLVVGSTIFKRLARGFAEEL